MARLTKTDAARQLGIARATLYKLIAQGKVSPTSDGLIDQAELVRVAPYIDTLHERTRSPKDVYERPQTSPDTSPLRPKDTEDIHTAQHTEDVYRRLQTGVFERLQTSIDTPERLQTSTDTLVDILRDQLRVMQEREREQTRLYEQRELAYREHIAQLTAMLHEAHQQNQRLLDMPRLAPQEAPQAPPGATQAPRRPARVPCHARTRPRGRQRPREGTHGAPCAGASWRCSRTIRTASRRRRCGGCWG